MSSDKQRKRAAACLRTRAPHPASIPIPVPCSSLPLGPERVNPTAVHMHLRGVPTCPRSSCPTWQVGLPFLAEECTALLPIYSLSRPSAPSHPSTPLQPPPLVGLAYRAMSKDG
ncbi:hypothetical protein EV363DRAFT_1439963 [Boletus edulis]|nr:hypothetical protein EV363DRAFT_1439963 [Boletus edulis]